MYSPVPPSEVVDRIKHIRDLHRQISPANDQEHTAYARREQKTRDLLSNLRRISHRPMLNLVHEIGMMNSLTIDGSHRLFGYDLDAIRGYDVLLNGARTHLVESYVFARDLAVELPRKLGPTEVFRRNAMLAEVVRDWQDDLPIRVLDRPGWKRPGGFYVHIGTEDSLGSSLPPGSLAFVEPIDEQELRRPNPLAIYLLQFPNGYRCSHCVISKGRLQLFSTELRYTGSEVYGYPSSVRIAGRVRMFASHLPIPDCPDRRSIAQYPGNAPLILPWEHRSRESLLATKQRRFVRSANERSLVQDVLHTTLNFRLSERSKRRYRQSSESAPHVDSLIHMTIENFARYTDSLRSGGFWVRDRNRYSLETLLRTKRYTDLQHLPAEAEAPYPVELWNSTRDTMREWPAILSMKFPTISRWDDRIIRVMTPVEVAGVEPQIHPGSWMLLDDAPPTPENHDDSKKRGWATPLYAFRDSAHTLIAQLERRGNSFALVSHHTKESRNLTQEEWNQLRRIVGVAIPV